MTHAIQNPFTFTNLCRLFSVLGEVLPKDFHDLRVELGHEDLDGLVRLGVDLPGEVAVQGVQGVEVPAVTAKWGSS